MANGDHVIKTTQLSGGDLSGTVALPVVSKVNGVAVAGTPAAGKVLTANSANDASWQLPTTTVTPDATNVSKGIVQLAGDLSGTADAPTVPGLATKESTANRGAANGYAPLDSNSKVPAANLPAYVDDVLEYANMAAFPATGSTGIIYVADDTGKIYRWSGSAYIEISPSPGSTDSVPEGTTNKYYTDSRVTTLGDTRYGQLATTNTWALSQTFSANPIVQLIKPTVQIIATGTSQNDNAIIRQYFSNSTFGNNAGVQVGTVQTDSGATATKYTIDKINNTGAYVSGLMSIDINNAATTFGTSVSPMTNLTQSLGTSSLYWPTGYIRTVNFNATAYLAGTTAGKIILSGLLNIPTGAAAGYVLGSNASGDAAWVAPSTLSPLTTKGDLYTYSTANTRLGVGADGTTLLADSTQPTGLRWAVPAGGGDMLTSTYDPAGIAQQVVGTTATQNITNKSFTDRLLLTSAATNGLMAYNTADQTTNFEVATAKWVSNVFTIATSKGGTGANRSLTITTPSTLTLSSVATNTISLTIADSTYMFDYARSTTTGGSGQSVVRMTGNMGGSSQNVLLVTGTLSSTGTNKVAVNIAPTINASGAASSTALLVNPTYTAVGSGPQLFADFQSSGVSKASIDNTGTATLANHVIPPVTVTVSSTIAYSQGVTRVNATGATTQTLPSTPPTGTILVIKNVNTGAVTVAGTIDGTTNYPLSTQYKYVTVQYNGTSWDIIANN